MTYRDQKEALRARVADLERELAKIAPGTRPVVGPGMVTLEHTLPFALSPSGYELIATLVHDRLQLQATRVGQTLTATGRGRDELSVQVIEGRTLVRIRRRFPDGGAGSGAALGAVVGGLAFAVLGVASHGDPAVAALAAFPLCVVGGAWAGSRFHTQQAERAKRESESMLRDIVAIAETNAVERVRMAETPTDEEDAPSVPARSRTERS